MSEQMQLNETELEKVTGGTADGGFEQAWAAYASGHCGNCMFVEDGKTTVCESEKYYAAQAYAAGQHIACKARTVAP